jgi:hypothetical protein
MNLNRNCDQLIILTIVPHLFALYFSSDNIVYTTIIISSTCSSYVWHYYHEPANYLLLIDYLFAGILSFSEIFYMYRNNIQWFYFSIYMNLYVLLFNKLVYILSINKTIKYSKWHSVYHLLSSAKTIFLSYLSMK